MDRTTVPVEQGGGSLAILGARGIPAAYGGFETFAEELSTRLAARGRDVTVYCERRDPDAPAEYRGVRLEYVPAPNLGPLSTLVFDSLCLWRARKRHDVVYMLGYAAAFACFIPRLWGTPVWINMDGIEWKRSKWSALGRMWLRLMEALATRTGSRLLCDAEGILRHLQTRHRRLPPASVIPYGAPHVEDRDNELLNEFGLTAGGYYIVVARLEPENHILEILEGFRKSASARRLVVVGDTSRETSYIARIKAIDDPRIQIVGGIYEREKLESLRLHAFAYFHGHSVGGTNPSLLEAMGCGNLILAHDNPFNREVAADGAVYFAEAGDIPDLIAAIEAPDFDGAALQARARDRIATIYNWDRVVNVYEDLLDQA